MSRRFKLARPVAALLLCVGAYCWSGAPNAAERPRVAIIIDDLGYVQAVGERVIALPWPVTCAILPGTPRATQLARQARDYRKEVLVHLPMQAMNARGEAEPGTLTLDMDRNDVAAVLAAALAAVPDAIGINNHRGSLLTRHPGHMQWLMDELRARPSLVFVDSFTTHHSVALQIAAESGVSAVKRDVFLDNDPQPERIRAELERLKRLARQRGSAVAIGHPYDSTLAVLEDELPGFAAEGIDIVPISSIVTNSRLVAYSKKGPAGAPQEKASSL